MPHYIGKRPNGKWFLFSSITDRFHGLDLEERPEGRKGGIFLGKRLYVGQVPEQWVG